MLVIIGCLLWGKATGLATGEKRNCQCCIKGGGPRGLVGLETMGICALWSITERLKKREKGANLRMGGKTEE